MATSRYDRKQMESDMTMHNYTVYLPAHVDVNAGGAAVTIDITELSPELIGQLALHGLRQKVADAAAGAKKVSEAEGETRNKTDIAFDLMSKVKVNLESGTWGATRGESSGGDGLSDLQRMIVEVATTLIKAADWKAKIAGWADMSTVERRAAKWTLLDGNASMPQLEAEAKRRMATGAISI